MAFAQAVRRYSRRPARFRMVIDLKWIGITRLAAVDGRDIRPFRRRRYLPHGFRQSHVVGVRN
jgi:hypothetical protein